MNVYLNALNERFHDYIVVVPIILAVINTFIAVILAQFFKKKLEARIALVVLTAVFSCAAIGAAIYSQYQIRAERLADLERKHEIRQQLGVMILGGAQLMMNCKTTSKKQAEIWLTKVTNYIEKELGPQYIARLTVPVPEAASLACNGGDEEQNQRYRLVLGINSHLNDIAKQSDF